MRHNLSEISAIIKDRRTIYPEFFSDRKVHREQIELLLNNAIWAPTHGKTQPWRFRVFMEEGREFLAQHLQESYAQWCNGAPDGMKLARFRHRVMASSAVIAIAMSPDPQGKIPEWEEKAAVACAIQNMHLTATAAGLGLFWSSPKFMSDGLCNEFLELEKADQVMGFIYIGYPEEWPQGQRRPIEYNTKWNIG